MSNLSQYDNPEDWKRPTVFYNYTTKWLVYLFITIFIIWSILGFQVSLDRLLLGLEEAQFLLSEMYPPNFGQRQRSLIITGMIESISMSVVSTVVGVALSIPLAFMSAKNISPKPVYLVGRGVLTSTRSFHALILALIAVKLVGVGPLAGAITLVIITIGFYGKLLAEDIEDIDQNQLEAMRATGADRFQVLIYGVVPQIMSRIIGLSVYRLDINLRASTIIGIVGAGGIGMSLINSFELFDYGFALAILLSIIFVVFLGEIFSAIIRRKD